MKIKVEMELNDARNIVNYFHNPPHLRKKAEEQKAKAALARMSEQVDKAMFHADEGTFH